MADVRGRKIAVLATDGVEQVKLTEPVKAYWPSSRSSVTEYGRFKPLGTCSTDSRPIPYAMLSEQTELSAPALHRIITPRGMTGVMSCSGFLRPVVACGLVGS